MALVPVVPGLPAGIPEGSDAGGESHKWANAPGVQALLETKLEQDEIAHRDGAGSQKVHFMEAWRAIQKVYRGLVVAHQHPYRIDGIVVTCPAGAADLRFRWLVERNQGTQKRVRREGRVSHPCALVFRICLYHSSDSEMRHLS